MILQHGLICQLVNSKVCFVNFLSFRSTNSDRTIETCQSVVAGFFDDHRDSKSGTVVDI